ncbi:hypothetical protein RYH80_09580 [Halobaculum sp. MBLA0147]|uniref:DUF7262 family protein n=1 Tax=Halobaculum sp. MBLA0147 TaxID=3079934 RepID=UPI0035244B50
MTDDTSPSSSETRWRPFHGSRGSTTRAQLSLPVVEAAIGVGLLLSVTVCFGVGLSAPPTAQTRLDSHATDAAAVLAAESPRHADRSRLVEVARSAATFERERDTLRRRVATVLGDGLLFVVRTPHGLVGDRPPPGDPVGRASVPTCHGAVVIEVWRP